MMMFRLNKKLNYIFNVVVLLASCLTINSQTLSDEDIKVFSKELNEKFKGLLVDPSSGVKGRGVISIGRKIVYQYDVPVDWFPYDDIKQILVKSLIEAGSDKIYIDNEIDLGYYYFKKNKLIKTLSLNWNELNKLRFSYGEYVDLTDHPKSNGLEFKIKKPLGWELEEGDGPHIVKKFVKGNKMFLVYVNETGQFLSKKEVQDLFNTETELLLDSIKKGFNINIVSYDIYSVENHPFLYISGIVSGERMGKKITGNTYLWYTFIEDQFVYFMGSNYSQEDNSSEFSLIMNSLKLLNQY